jgi:hypothetical protein
MRAAVAVAAIIMAVERAALVAVLLERVTELHQTQAVRTLVAVQVPQQAQHLVTAVQV